MCRPEYLEFMNNVIDSMPGYSSGIKQKDIVVQKMEESHTNLIEENKEIDLLDL